LIGDQEVYLVFSSLSLP